MIEYIFSATDDKFTHRIVQHESGFCICGARVHAKTNRLGNTFAVLYPRETHKYSNCAELAAAKCPSDLRNISYTKIIADANRMAVERPKTAVQVSAGKKDKETSAEKGTDIQIHRDVPVNTVPRLLKAHAYYYDPNQPIEHGRTIGDLLMTPWWLSSLIVNIKDMDRYILGHFNVVKLTGISSKPSVERIAYFQMEISPCFISSKFPIIFELTFESEADWKAFLEKYVVSGANEYFRYETKPREANMWFAVYAQNMRFLYRKNAGILYTGSITKIQNVKYIKELNSQNEKSNAR